MRVAAPLFSTVALLGGLLLGACARLPAEEARGTPAEAVARLGFAALSADGLSLGSAVAVAPDRLLTNAHVLPPGLERLRAQRGDGLATTEARLLALSPALDLAILAVEPGLFVPVPVSATPPVAGERLWAVGAPTAGAALAVGEVEQPGVEMAGRGPGFIARIGALMGYSGGPAVDAEGNLRGLTTALPRAGGSLLLAMLTGLDLGGMTRNRQNREVFFLSIAAAMVESERIAPSRCSGCD